MFDPSKQERTIQDIKNSCGMSNVEQIKWVAKHNYGFFLEHVLGLNMTSGVTQEAVKFHQNPYKHKETGAEIEGVKAAVMAPRGHSKTFSWTIGPALWRGYRETGWEIIISSASRSQSKKILAKLKRIIKRNEMLHHLESSTENLERLEGFTDINKGEDAWAKKSVTLTTDVQITTKTYSSSIRSEHVDMVLLDDILQDDGQAMERVRDIFYNVVTPIVENKAGILQVVGTPQEHGDLLMELVDKDSYYSVEMQAYNPETDDVLWGDKWSVESLMEKKEETGPARFAREYMCNPMSVDERYFDDECMAQVQKHMHWKPDLSVDRYDDWVFFCAGDVALGKGSDSDFNVVHVLGKNGDDELFHVDVWRQRVTTPQDYVDELLRLDDKYSFRKLSVEKNGQGEGLADEIRKHGELANRTEFFDTTGRSRPEILSSLQAAMYRGDILIYPSDNLVDEFTKFSKNKNGKLVGAGKDDNVMAMSIAYNTVKGDVSRVGGGIPGVTSMSGTGFDGDQDSSSDGFRIGIV